MRASGRICWRMASSALKSEMTALSALTPRHGHDEACAAWPKNSAFTLMIPRLGRHAWVPQRPWIIMAASTPSKTPASISFTLPAPPSSAGVPMTWMRPANGSVPSAASAALDARAVLFEELREPGVRPLLLERELGRGVDAMRESLEIVGDAVDDLGNLRLDGVGAAHVAASNSRRASLTSAGFASRSHVVMAMILADVSIPSRASGHTAACSNAREWIGVPSGAICTIGWMAGMTWLTLPTSELPMRSRLSGDSTTPNVRALARKRSSSVVLRFI